MIIYPAIDIKDGKCVRLFQGDFTKTTVYSDDPVEIALKWQTKGAEYLHIVDLDGALAGYPKNLSIIKSIIKEIKIPLQIGGGIRSIETGNTLLELGASRIIMGTSAVKSPDTLQEAIRQFGSKLAIGVDTKNKMVAIEGWKKNSNLPVVDFIKKLEDMCVNTVIYTDISKDGTLQGPDIIGISKILSESNIKIIASGGIGKLQDLIKLKELRVNGAIVGKALYSGNFSLEEALEI